MKRCPTCEKTFDDNLRFCQADGTPLVDDVEDVDPYKTMVARPGDIAAAIASSEGRASEPPPPEPEREEPVLELPEEPDPNKTQFVSEEELRAEMAAADEPVVDIPSADEPPRSEPPMPEPPKFNDPEVAAPKFEGGPPPPSPFGEQPPSSAGTPPPDERFSKTSPPIPSPFGGSAPGPGDLPRTPEPSEPHSVPATPEYDEPQPSAAEPGFNPFDRPAHQAAQPLTQAEQPPTGGEAPIMQNPEFGQGHPQPPPPSVGSAQNKTLAIVSLVLGILGMTICCGTLIFSLGAVVTGFMAKSKAASDPANYGGAGFALGGIITGALGLILSIGYLIFVFFMGGLQIMMQGM
jgi:hypothetical protein